MNYKYEILTMTKHGFIAIDLEMEQPCGTIISVGVAFETNEITFARDFFITPQKPLSPFIKELTGLQDTQFNWKMSRDACWSELADQLHALKLDWEQQGYAFSNQVVTWGHGDVPLLMAQTTAHLPFISRRFIDLKTLITMERVYRGQKINQASLSSALRSYKIPFDGTAHCSKDDALATMRLFNQYIKEKQNLYQCIADIKAIK